MRTFNIPGRVKMAENSNILEGNILAIDYDREFIIAELIGDHRPRTLDFSEILYVSVGTETADGTLEVLVYDKALGDEALPMRDSLVLTFLENQFEATNFMYRTSDGHEGSREVFISLHEEDGKYLCGRETGLPVYCETIIEALAGLVGTLDSDFKYPIS